MASHFATDGLLWHFGPDNLRVRASLALDGQFVDSLTMADEKPLPSWILEKENSRLIISGSGAAFLSDAGFGGTHAWLKALQAAGTFRKLEGIWVSHYHDDHTDEVQKIAEDFKAPVYFTQSMTDILNHPGHYRMPCLTTNPINTAKGQRNGRVMKWREFDLTFLDFPGQTLYHGAMLLRHPLGDKF